MKRIVTGDTEIVLAIDKVTDNMFIGIILFDTKYTIIKMTLNGKVYSYIMDKDFNVKGCAYKDNQAVLKNHVFNTTEDDSKNAFQFKTHKELVEWLHS